MNRVIIVLLVLIVGAQIWMAARQRRFEHQIDSLRAENVRLTRELAQKPDLSPEEFNAASRRLEEAGMFMNAMEGRLNAASELLSQLQAASQSYLAEARPRPVSRGVGPAPGPGIPEGRLPAGAGAIPAAPASSHSPDGQLLQRSWGPEQLLGPPNTHSAGDIPTAWAPRASRGAKDEWLHVNYDRAVEISEVRVRETYNPGAIAKIAAVMPDGHEVVIWEGVTPPAEAPMDTAFSVPAGVRGQSVKIYLDRTRAPGWNEIDAVELVGRDGSRQWAISAKASSSFADP